MADDKERKYKHVAEESATSFDDIDTPKINNPRRPNRLLYNPNSRRLNLGAPTDLDDDEETDETEENLNEEEVENPSESAEESSSEAENSSSPGETIRTVAKTTENTISKLFFWKRMLPFIAIGGVLLVIILIILMVSFSTIAGNDNSKCEVEGHGGTLISFLDAFEGASQADTCDKGNGYRGYDIHDGAISIGPGLTNSVISSTSVAAYIRQNGWANYFHKSGSNFRIDVGICIPKIVIEKIKLFILEDTFAPPIDVYAEKYDVELTQFQKDALTSFNYNLGPGHTEELIKAYVQGSYMGLWDAMKDYDHATINGVYGVQVGLQKRRKAEFALFVTGDYSDQNKFYNRTIKNYDDYNSEGVMDRRASCDDEISTNYTKVTSSGLNDVLTQPLKSKLAQKNTTYKEFNEYILKNVINAGVGTRNGVVAAAVSLVGGLYEKYQIRLPYTYGGQHGGNVGVPNPASGTFYGVDPLWGSSIHYYFGSPVYRTYYRYGPDCSGFVMWALYNGGFKINYPYTPKYNLQGKKVGKPGDLMWHPGHIMMVVGVDEKAKKYYIAHAAGGDQGVKISTVSFTDSQNKIINMDSFYANKSNKLYTDSDKFSKAFRAGQL